MSRITKDNEQYRAAIREGFTKKPEPMVKYFNIDEIILNAGTQARVQLDNNVIDEYAESMKEPEVEKQFPRIYIIIDEGKYYLADGFHRLAAYKKLGYTKVEAKWTRGTLRDAILYSLKANAKHGLRRTNEDKRKAVLTLLNDEEWSKKSVRELAEMASVSPNMISMFKNELGIVNDVIIGKDGKEYHQNQKKEIKERTKFYRPKLDLSYQIFIKKAISISKKNETALLKEAMEYIRNKYKIQDDDE